MTASVTRGRALRYAGGSARGLLHHHRGHWPEATVAHGLVSKYADHLPLYRQAQIYSRQGIDLDRSIALAALVIYWL